MINSIVALCLIPAPGVVREAVPPANVVSLQRHPFEKRLRQAYPGWNIDRSSFPLHTPKTKRATHPQLLLEVFSHDPDGERNHSFEWRLKQLYTQCYFDGNHQLTSQEANELFFGRPANHWLVEQLIKELDSEKYVARERAEARLLAQGTPLLINLSQYDFSKLTAEQSSRLLRVRQTLANRFLETEGKLISNLVHIKPGFRYAEVDLRFRNIISEPCRRLLSISTYPKDYFIGQQTGVL